MSVKVYGTISLSNGTQSDVSLRYPMNWGSPDFNVRGKANIKIAGKYVTVEFEDTYDYLKDVPETEPLQIKEEYKKAIDDIFVTARRLLNAAISGLVFYYRIGLSYTLNSCVLSDNTLVNIGSDYVPLFQEIDGIELNLNSVIDILAKYPLINQAVEDYSFALLYRENSPVFFRRASEAIVQHFVGIGRNVNWNKFDNDFAPRMGLDGDISYRFKKITDELMHPHRHGNKIFFTAEQHTEMKNLATIYLYRAVKYLMESP